MDIYKAKYKIYAIICPITKEVKYVGRTTRDDVRVRVAEHYTAYENGANKMPQWLRSLQTAPVVAELESGLSREESGKRERYWIHRFTQEGHVLFNVHGKNGVSVIRKESIQLLNLTDKLNGKVSITEAIKAA